MIGTVPNDAAHPRFFRSPSQFGRWLKANHATARELWVGFHKVGSGTPSMTWPQSVDEALCVGWIDGIRKGLDAHRYVIRFTPRKTTSTWSAVNIKRIGELIAEGRVLPAGLRAFEKRTEKRSVIYAYEQRDTRDFPPMMKKMMQGDKLARTFFEAQPPWYRRKVIWWVTSAKQEATRTRRMQSLVTACREQRQL